MAVYPSPALVLVPALVIDAIAAVLARPRASRRGPMSLLILAIAAAVLFAIGAFLGFGELTRAWPIWLGLGLGAVQFVLWGWLLPAPDAQPRTLAPATSGLALLAVIGLAVPGAVSLANAALGLMLGWGLPVLGQALMGQDDDTLAAPDAIALGFVATVAGAASWGEKLMPQANFGLPLSLALGTLALIALGLGRFLTRSSDGTVTRSRVAGWAALGVFLLGSAGLLLLYSQSGAVMLAVTLGGVLGVGLPLLAPRDRAIAPAGAVIALVLTGVALVLDNRLGGILGIALGGFGLVLGARPGEREIGFSRTLAVLVTIAAGRVWLQLFLDRTALSGYGVDLTHPYAFAALMLGAFAIPGAGAIARVLAPARSAQAVWALLLALVPLWFGYFVHVEALGALMAGGLAGLFAVGAGLADRRLAGIAGPWLIVNTSVALLSAPWLVSVMNAARSTRAIAFVVGVIVLAAIALWARRQVLGRTAVPA